MKANLKVAMIGLDTSHSMEFARRMQAPDCPPDAKVHGMEAVSCLRFVTPFTDNDILDHRQTQLEAWGVHVTESFEEAVSDCDVIMLEINDPAYHLEYFTRCSNLNKPIFLDKPLADTYGNGKKICILAKEKNLKVLSASSLRHAKALVEACKEVPGPVQAYCYGPLGIPPVGSGIVWYGVHCFEMLQRAMGRGAVKAAARKDPAGAVIVVEYPDNRRGIVELTVGAYAYGGSLRAKDKNQSFVVDASMIYTEQLREIHQFFLSGETTSSMDDALEVMDLLDAAARSYETDQPVMLHDSSGLVTISG